MIEFYEQRFKQDGKNIDIDKLMTEEEQKRVSYYVEKYEELKRQMSNRLDGDSGWENIEKAYRSKRIDKSLYNDNEREINIILPQIEGQVSSMTSNNISGTYKGVGYSDSKFAKTAGKVGEFILSQNDTRNIVKNFSRRYVKFGTAVLTVDWDKDALNGMGIPKFKDVKTSKVFVDDKVNDVVLDLESADYIIHEVGRKSLEWARREYGDDIANAIELGNNSDDFEEKNENKESFTYLRVWTRNNEKRKLQLLEISMNGILLKQSEDSSSYYKYVFDKYPFFFAGMYKDESDSYYFGDGYILLPEQEYINKLMDAILRAIQYSSQGRTYANINSGLNPDDFARNDPGIPLMVRNIGDVRTERGVGISEVVFSLLQLLFTRIQELTRFSSLMTGNGTGETLTATQAGIQMQQGITGIDDKKKDISRAFGKALGYALGMTMQFWNSAKAFRLVDNEDDFEWIDVRHFRNIPVEVPSTSQYKADFKKRNPKNDAPEFMQLTRDVEAEETDEFGNTTKTTKTEGVTKELELDITVSIGEGLPANKMATYNIIMQLSQLPVFDPQTGTARPIIEINQFRDMVESIFGLKLSPNGSTKESVQNIIDERNNAQSELEMMREQEAFGSRKQAMPNPVNVNANIPMSNTGGTRINPRSMLK